SCASSWRGASPSGGFRTRSSSSTRFRRLRSASSGRPRCARCSRSLCVFRSALVTGGASGIGAAAVALLEVEGVDVRVLDLATGFDVGDAAAWEEVGPVDFAFLNAGVTTGAEGIAAPSDEAYRR